MKILILVLSFIISNINCIHLNQTVLFDLGYTSASTFIDLNKQDINDIDETTFEEFQKLEVLYLTSNKISRIHIHYFVDFIRILLKVLKFFRNNFQNH